MGVDGRGGGRGSCGTEVAAGMWLMGTSGSGSQPCQGSSMDSRSLARRDVQCPRLHPTCLISIHDLGLVLASDCEAGVVTGAEIAQGNSLCKE